MAIRARPRPRGRPGNGTSPLQLIDRATLRAGPIVTFPATLPALPVTLNLNLYAGDDFTMRLAVRDTRGRRLDLSAATIRAQIRERSFPFPVPGPVPPVPPPVLASFLVGRGESEIFLHLTGAASAGLPRSTVWDVDITLGGVVTTLAGGAITMSPEVSR